MNTAQFEKLQTGNGFIAALDQSGGSTPKALRLYGIEESEYSGDEEMFDLMHAMRDPHHHQPELRRRPHPRRRSSSRTPWTARSRVADSADYLWNVKHVVPFLKVDKGLVDEADGVQLDEADAGSRRAARPRAWTRASSARRCARSSSSPTKRALRPIVDQQFEVGQADPRCRPGADHRARDRHQEPAEGGGRSLAEDRDPRRARCSCRTINR